MDGTTTRDHKPSFTTPLVIRLRIQYRMIPEICNTHARLFYPGREIINFRSHPEDRRWRGLFYEQLPNEFGDELKRKEAKRALELYVSIRRQGHTRNGEPWTIMILTPYIETMTYITSMAEEKKIRGVSISTIDRVQGAEYDAVILTTSRSRCVDLGRDRHRGNVATSRARDLLIIMAHPQFVTATRMIHPPKTKPRKLRFWAHLVDAARLWQQGNVLAIGTRTRLKELIARESKGSGPWLVSISTGVMQRIASNALEVIEHFRSDQKRKDVLSVLLLKDKLKNNSPMHLNLFVKLLECEWNVFKSALQIIRDSNDAKSRNVKLCALLQLNVKDKPSVATQDIVGRMYLKDGSKN